MKYAITGPRGRVYQILDEPNDRTVEITDEQAAIVATGADKMGYWFVAGVFRLGAEYQAARKAEMEATRIAAMTPEQLAEHQVCLQRQAAYDAASAVFEGMTAGKRAMWEPVRAAVAKAIMAGDFAAAKEILLTLPAIYPDAETERQQFLTLFLP